MVNDARIAQNKNTIGFINPLVGVIFFLFAGHSLT